ncbi:hypothetical protein EMCRGX_G005980 [Ephydatia muelleri]
MSLTERSILSIPSNVLTKLVYALTVESPLDPPRDWRGLAAYVGFPHRVISLIEQHRESSKAWHVLRLWEQTGTSSVRKLLIALMELSLRECLDILRGELGDAYLQYESAELLVAELKAAGTDVQSHLFKPLKEEELELYPEMNGDDDMTLNMESFYMPLRMASSSPMPRSVYISHLPDRAHKRAVADMTRHLTEAGFEAYSAESCRKGLRALMKGADYWREQCITKAESIVIVCTRKYFREDQRLALEGGGSRSPIGVDRYLLRHIAYHGGSRRIVPVVVEMASSCEDVVPVWAGPLACFRWPEQKMELLRSLASVPQYEKPRVEQKIHLKPIQINFPEASNWSIED